MALMFNDTYGISRGTRLSATSEKQGVIFRLGRPCAVPIHGSRQCPYSIPHLQRVQSKYAL